MSINVEQAIIHSIIQDGEGQLSCRLRPQPLLNSQAVEAMLEELHQTYTTKAGKGFGHFGISGEDGEANTKFEEALKTYRSGELGFVEFSGIAGKLLQEELAKYDFSTGGFLLLSCYTYMTSDYLFVSLLNAKSSMTVLDDMELSQNTHLDLNNVQLAARIDLTEWQAEPESKKYISFIRGRAGRKVADFFLDFMGCVEGVNTKAQNKSLMNAVEDFVGNSELTKDERQQARERVFDYCTERCDEGASIQIKDLADELADQGMDSFYDFAQSGSYDLAEEFPGDKPTLRQLKKFSGTGGGVTLSFDGQHLGERVIYDPVSDTIIIKGVPANLKDQLDRRLKGE
ncbi:MULTISPECIES: nucleoid-associated protein YejK [Shewanella]|uniref:Nucleoid-associated protein OS133_07500 n=1 Tax=Shewanella fidelis TaxID=173509 RepID=A0AAW8NJS3_9GAMM|nr:MULTISPECIES: nucleoid-associated protein YejK [Shewanella]MDR8523529.1 nucleoid-associated protein YejK [Shewanella fidelis]MDW4810076.1 nucleoid-associated protein YejK [Shewanella fidelis]MDW4814221.1 nucleoid-associated protein YejK [Shewanella fidelis]MDW4822252.1 nucleoid-associated protein YejK [Shewanella fidelis]MDW4826343.1 nucleoid-associated protein YejK [Shewanella fidelis]